MTRFSVRDRIRYTVAGMGTALSFGLGMYSKAQESPSLSSSLSPPAQSEGSESHQSSSYVIFEERVKPYGIMSIDPEFYLTKLVKAIHASQIPNTEPSHVSDSSIQKWAKDGLEVLAMKNDDANKNPWSVGSYRITQRYEKKEGASGFHLRGGSLQALLTRSEHCCVPPGQERGEELVEACTHYDARITLTRDTPYSSPTSPTINLALTWEPCKDSSTYVATIQASGFLPTRLESSREQLMTLKDAVERLTILFPPAKE